MPIISTFYGIIIQMYWRDHSPPHFHARYAGEQVAIDIHTLKILQGKMSHRALTLVLEWAQEHRDKLMEGWELCQHRQLPNAGAFAVLADPDVLAQVYVELGAVTWLGELDLALDAMHDEIEKTGSGY